MCSVGRPGPMSCGNRRDSTGVGAQRVMNLMNAWRNQMLAALGAIGMRGVRRPRGEIGRTIWHRTEEAVFREVLGGSRPVSALPVLKIQTGGEGDFRWPQSLLLITQQQARTGLPPVESEWEYRFGASEGGFDRLAFAFELEMDPAHLPLANPAEFDLSLSLNRRADGRLQVVISVPWYGAEMSYGSVSLPVMLARARAAQAMNTLVSTGEGGYPEELTPYADHIITQVATGMFGVREETIRRARVVEIKYAQGAKPGLGGHLLGNKNTDSVARLREAVPGTSLFSPCPFHSVYSVEDHEKHVDWLKQVDERALISAKVSTPTDVDMVAVGIYYAFEVTSPSGGGPAVLTCTDKFGKEVRLAPGRRHVPSALNPARASREFQRGWEQTILLALDNGGAPSA
ncbi:MAG: hypothetical protein D6793_03050 [Thermoflexia bacterium]|nr:MAG: hypothetical protein D6793_03050 [Thermoflexia bacterium]